MTFNIGSLNASATSKHQISISLSGFTLKLNDRLVITYPSSYNLNSNPISCYKDLNIQTSAFLLNCNVDSTQSNKLNIFLNNGSQTDIYSY